MQKIFCYAPWTNINVGVDGDVKPCAKFLSQSSDQKFNVQKDSIQDYQNSQLLAQVKANFKNGQWPQQCLRCQIEEQNGIDSKRILDQRRWQQHYQTVNLDSDKILTASISFGNACNLKCITCGPTLSSKWAGEFRDLYQIDIKPVLYYKQSFVEELLSSISESLIQVDIPGGEPLLSIPDEQKKFLEGLIDSGRSKEITLHYTTNISKFPSRELWHLWKQFKQVELQLSIDGLGEKFEYIRYPADWATTVNNIQQYQYQRLKQDNIRLSVSHTLSIFNIYYLDEFLTWTQNQRLPRPWIGRVHDPDFLRCTVWPQQYKKQLIDRLQSSQHTECHTWANLIMSHDDSELYPQFQQFVRRHDQYRGLDFALVFPESAKFLTLD